MYFEELLQCSYISSEEPTEDEIVLLRAGCRKQIDRNLVVSKADFDTILMDNRAKDPASEAVLITIGQGGQDLSDPLWDTMLQRESVVDRFTQLCNSEVANTLSALEGQEAAEAPAFGYEEGQDGAEVPTFGYEESGAPPSFGIEGGGEDTSQDENGGFGYPEGASAPPVFGDVNYGEPAPEPVVQIVAPVAQEMYGIPAGEDCMGLYLDSPEYHLPYEAEVFEGEEVEDAPAPGATTSSGVEEVMGAPLPEGVEDAMGAPLPEGVESVSGFPWGAPGFNVPEAGGIIEEEGQSDPSGLPELGAEEAYTGYVPPVPGPVPEGYDEEPEVVIRPEGQLENLYDVSAYSAPPHRSAPMPPQETVVPVEPRRRPGFHYENAEALNGISETGRSFDGVPEANENAGDLASTVVPQEPVAFPVEVIPAEEPTVAPQIPEELRGTLETVKNSFALFHDLVRQYSLAVILGSEGLTSESFCSSLLEEFPMFGGQYQESLSTYGYDYDRAACDLVQLLQLEAESAVFSGDLARAEKCITPVCKLIYS